MVSNDDSKEGEMLSSSVLREDNILNENTSEHGIMNKTVSDSILITKLRKKKDCSKLEQELIMVLLDSINMDDDEFYYSFKYDNKMIIEVSVYDNIHEEYFLTSFFENNMLHSTHGPAVINYLYGGKEYFFEKGKKRSGNEPFLVCYHIEHPEKISTIKYDRCDTTLPSVYYFSVKGVLLNVEWYSERNIEDNDDDEFELFFGAIDEKGLTRSKHLTYDYSGVKSTLFFDNSMRPGENIMGFNNEAFWFGFRHDGVLKTIGSTKHFKQDDTSRFLTVSYDVQDLFLSSLIWYKKHDIVWKHCLDGPAVIHYDNTGNIEEEYFVINNQKYSFKEWLKHPLRKRTIANKNSITTNISF